MDLFLDDLVNGLVHQVQENVVPRVEEAAQKANERLKAAATAAAAGSSDLLPIDLLVREAATRLRKTPPLPPSHTDILYLTERFLVSSQPAVATEPTYYDVGRDAVPSDAAAVEPSSAASRSKEQRQMPADASRREEGAASPVTNPSLTQGGGGSGLVVPIRGRKLNDLAENPDSYHERDDEERSSNHEEDSTTAPALDGGGDTKGDANVPNNSVLDPEEENPQDGTSNEEGNHDEDTTKEAEQNGSAVVVSEGDEIGLVVAQESTSSGVVAVDVGTDVVPQTRTESVEDVDATLDGLLKTPQYSIGSAEAVKVPSVSTEQPREGAPRPLESISAISDAAIDAEISPVDKTADTTSIKASDEPDSVNGDEIVQGTVDFDCTKMDDEASKEAEIKSVPELRRLSGREYRDASDSDGIPLDPYWESAPIHSTQVTRDNAEEKLQDPADAENPEMGVDVEEKQQLDEDQSSPKPKSQKLPIGPIKNSPGTMVTFLDQRHGRNHYLAYSMTNESPDDRTLLLFRRQIVQLGWWSPCMDRSETPSISKLLKACYAIHAYLQLDPSNVALVYCANGKTRTAIVSACYLRFAGMVRTSEEGFLHFLSKRGILRPNDVLRQVPPSLKLFFAQFDKVLDLGCFLNRKPLLLKAIALQGVPVEDQPCLDIWDSSQQHVYSSHPEMWQHDASLQRRMANKSGSQWADEEGFYKVNVILDGDFLLLCRFGGDFAQETKVHDPSKILFRYANTTGFISGGCPYELPSQQVDLMRRYAKNFDEEEFLVTLLFEADWEYVGGEKDNELPETYANRLKTTSETCGERVWRSHEEEACEEGWKVIFARHSVRPSSVDIAAFKRFGRDRNMMRCSNHLVALSLKLTDYDYKKAVVLLLESPAFSWWQGLRSTPGTTVQSKAVHDEKEETKCDRSDQLDKEITKSIEAMEEEATQDILSILDRIDVSVNLEEPDRRRLDRFKEGAKDAREAITPLENLGTTSQREHQTPLHGLCLQDSGWMVPTIMYPRRGDVVRSFGFSQQRNVSGEGAFAMPKSVASLAMERKPKPTLPYFPRDKPAILIPPSKASRNDGEADAKNYTFPVYDPTLQAAKELHAQLRHTGVTLEGLVQLSENSKTWTEPAMIVDEAIPTHASEPESTEEPPNAEPRDSSMNRDAKEKKEKKWKDDQRAEAEEKQKASDEKGLSEAVDERGLPQEVLNQEGTDGSNEVPLKDDPGYAKYFKMIKLGMPKEQVLHAMKRDEKDPMVLDLDPTKSLESQVRDDGDGSPLQDDPEYAKYFKMIKLGMPKEQVEHAMKRDEKDPGILNLDPTRSLQSQLESGDGPPLKDDPEFSKYFRMLKLGMPKEQVVHAMTRDEKDVKILDLDPTKSLKSQKSLYEDDGPPLQDDPEYAKYFKMLKMGMPKEQVTHAMTRDDKDVMILDLDPTKSLKSQQVEGNADGPPLKDDPEYSKYFKMLAMKLPMGAVRNALVRDGKDPTIMDLDPNRSVKSQSGGGRADVEDSGPPLKDDPEYVKYFKMLAMNLPMGAVKNALARDGKDPAIMDLDPSKSVKSQLGGESAEEKDTGIALKDDPEYAKYFKMEKMGLPRDAVKNALVRDGKDPGIMDLDPNKSVAFQIKRNAPSGTKKSAKKKKKVRRKKIYWNPIDPGKLKEDSMWNIVRDYVAMDKLTYDEKEFEELFTESAETSDKKKKKEPQKEVKKLVQVIDPKRSMNGGIVLARLKTDHAKVAEYVNKMEYGKFDSTQLKALKEYLPDADERRGLIAYLKKGDKSEDRKQQLFADLSETEKYMVTLMDVPDVGPKLDAMLFRNVFTNRFEDITNATRTLNAACDELRSSEKLRKLMAMILTVVNQINTGGEGHLAMGFTLDALLKLNEAKAFDKKTSVLHYVVKLVKKNDEALLSFQSDIVHVIPAESVLLDSLAGEVKAILDELESVLEIVQNEAGRLEDAGELRKMSLADLAEQKTLVQHVGTVAHFNKIAHLTGRTSMERFTLNAKVACDQAAESIDNVKKKYAMVLGYFGEDENMTTGDFFGILRRFMREWKKATDQVEKIEKAEAKERKRAANKAAKEEKRKSRKVPKNAPGEKKLPGRSGLAAIGGRLRKEDEPVIQLGGLRGLQGIASAAAAAGKLKSEKLIATKNAEVSPGDIAGLAAHAALMTSVRMLENKPDVGAARIAGVAPQAAMGKVQDQTEGITTDAAASRPKGIADLAAQAALKKIMLSNSKSSTGDRPKNDLSLSDHADASPYQQSRKTSEVYDDRGEPSDLEKARSNKGRIIDVPEYAAAATQFQRRSYEKQIYDERGEPVILHEKEAKAATSSTPDYAKAASQLQERTAREKVYDENGEPFRDVSESIDKDEATRKSAFAAKAAAYRKRKVNKDEKDASNDDEEGSRLLSSFSASQKNKKPHQNLYDDLKESFGEVMNSTEGEKYSEIGAVTTKEASDVGSTELHEAVPELSFLLKQEAPRKTPPAMLSREEPSLASFLGRHQTNTERSTKQTTTAPPSLGSFFERQAPHDIRTEILRQNYDDSSVAIMADMLEKKAVDDSEFGGPVNWNEGGGISDFIGWANLAIQSSDTESVRGFEISRNLDDQHDYDDDSTIATYYDDDASIVSSGTMTPRQRDGPPISFDHLGDFGHGDTNDAYNLGSSSRYDAQYDTDYDDEYARAPYDDNVPSVTAKVAASILFNDSETDSSVDQNRRSTTTTHAHPRSGRDSELIDMALTFNDVGLDAGLSFGGDVGFDDGLGFGGVEDSSPGGGFGVSAAAIGHAEPGNAAFSYPEQYAPGASSHLPNSPDQGDDGGPSDKPKAGSKWFQWGMGK